MDNQWPLFGNAMNAWDVKLGNVCHTTFSQFLNINVSPVNSFGLIFSPRAAVCSQRKFDRQWPRGAESTYAPIKQGE